MIETDCKMIVCGECYSDSRFEIDLKSFLVEIIHSAATMRIISFH
jgi:hypothetical protein